MNVLSYYFLYLRFNWFNFTGSFKFLNCNIYLIPVGTFNLIALNFNITLNPFRSCHTQSSLIEDDQICGVLGGR